MTWIICLGIIFSSIIYYFCGFDYSIHRSMSKDFGKKNKNGKPTKVSFEEFKRMFNSIKWYAIFDENDTFVKGIKSLHNFRNDSILLASLFQYRGEYYYLGYFDWIKTVKWLKEVTKDLPLEEEKLYHFTDYSNYKATGVPARFSHKGTSIFFIVDKQGNIYNDLGEKLN